MMTIVKDKHVYDNDNKSLMITKVRLKVKHIIRV